MKRLVLLALLAGCAHDPILQARKFFCARESCPAYAELYHYVVLEQKYDVGLDACVCTLRSLDSGRTKVVTVPRGTPADSL